MLGNAYDYFCNELTNKFRFLKEERNSNKTKVHGRGLELVYTRQDNVLAFKIDGETVYKGDLENAWDRVWFACSERAKPDHRHGCGKCG